MTPQLRTLIYVSEKKRLLLNLATGAEEPALDKHLQYQNLLGSGPLYVDTVGFTGSILKLPAWERIYRLVKDGLSALHQKRNGNSGRAMSAAARL
jgi:hypothetical protein